MEPSQLGAEAERPSGSSMSIRFGNLLLTADVHLSARSAGLWPAGPDLLGAARCRLATGQIDDPDAIARLTRRASVAARDFQVVRVRADGDDVGRSRGSS